MSFTFKTVGESSESIFEQLTALHGLLQSSSQLEDVFAETAQKFFRQLHAVFSRSRTEQNHKCLNLLMEVIQECCYVANRKQRYNSVSPLLTDILMCLLSADASQSAESLLTYINTECDIELRNELKEEIDRILLNSKDQKLVQAVKSIPGLVSNSPKEGSMNSPKGSRASGGNSTGSSSTPRESKGSATPSTSTGSGFRSGGGIMKLSFLPHSIREQWLLASGVDELRFVLEEVTAVYSSLSISNREGCKADMPTALKQVMTNITAEPHSSVAINGLKFMETVSDYNVEAFLDDRSLLELLFPKLSKCLESSKEDLRRGAMRLAVSLVAQLPYHITDKFVLQCVENESKYPGAALKLACVALIAAGREMSGETRNHAMSSTLPLRLARVAKAAVLVLNDYEREESKAREKAGKDASVPISLIQCTDIAKDAVAAALLVLCPHEANESSGIFPEFLPNSFVDRLLSCTEGPPRRPVPLSAAIQAEITLRASGLSFPSLVTDPIVSSHVQAILNSKVASFNAASSPSVSGSKGALGARRRRDSDSGGSDIAAGGDEGVGQAAMTPDKDKHKSSTWPGSPSPTSRRVSPSSLYGSTMPSVIEGGGMANVDGDEHRSLKYQPSWGSGSMEHAGADPGLSSPLDRAFRGPGGGGVPSSPVQAGAGDEDGVDRSKLHHLKNSRRKPGSRRAHSAEIGSVRDVEAANLREAPSTSDGHRVVKAAGGAAVEPSVQYVSVGNYTGQDGGHKTMKLGAAANAAGSGGGSLDKDEKKKKRAARGSLTDLLDTSEYIVGDYSNNRIIPDQDDLETSFGGSGFRDFNPNLKGAGAGGGGVKRSPRAMPGAGAGGHAETMSRLEQARSQREQAERNLMSMFNEYDVSNATGGGAANGAGGGSSGQEQKKYAYFAGSEMAAGGPGPGPGPGPGAGAGAAAKKKGKKTLRRRSDERDRERDRSSSPRRDKDEHSPGGADAESKREGPSALKPESLDYLDTDEITPCSDPRADLSKATSALLTDDWLEIFHALNVVRQLALHHQALLLSSGKGSPGPLGPPIGSPAGARSPSSSGKHQAPALRALASAVLKQVDNLRSQVAKNAIVTIGDMFIGLKSKMDPEVPSVVPVLIKKCGDQATSFLSESAESTLCHLIDHASPARSLNAFVGASDNRNPALRGKVAGFLGFLISQKADELRGLNREIDTLKTRLKTLINDNTPEARASSRDIVRIMLETRLSTRPELELMIPPETIDKALRSAPNMHLSPKRSASHKKGSTSPKKSRTGLGGFGAAKSPSRGGGASSSSYMDSGDEGLDIDLSRFNVTPAQGALLSDEEDDEDDIESSGGGGGGGPGPGFVSPIKKKSAGRGGNPSAPFSSSSLKKTGGSSSGAGAGAGGGLSADMGNIPNGMGTPSRAKAMSAKRQLENSEELRALPGLLANGARSASWKERMDTTAAIAGLLCRHMIVLRDSSKLEPCMEFILAGLEDGSVKVNIQSLQSLLKIHVEVPALLPNLQLTVLPALLKAASSGNRSVSASALPILRDILSSFSVQHVVTQLCHMALYEADRLRIMSLKVLAEQVSKVCGTGNPATNNSVRTTIFPTIKTILLGSGTSAARGDMRIGCADVLKEIQKRCELGEHVSQWVDDKADQDAIKKCFSTKG